MVRDNDIQKKFGGRVRELRLQKGITSQMDLANKSGLDRTYVGGVERGERNIGLKNIEKLAKAIGISIKEFFEP